jgi:L-lysine 2,3-aminomutase
MESVEEKVISFSPQLQEMIEHYQYPEETIQIIEKENLLPEGLLNRLDNAYPRHSGIFNAGEALFKDKHQYAGKKGFREIVKILLENGIDIGYQPEREFFIDVYRFMVTKHTLNAINWNNFAKDSLFQLTFPQPEMIDAETTRKYVEATEEERKTIVEEHRLRTNPHDGKQQLNKPWYETEEGELEIIEGSQHKYPQVHLIFDKTTQSCFSFCTYCFRHAQVRGDEDMFIQHETKPVHEYIKRHKEITDILITGGDAGYMPVDRLEEYLLPVIDDPELSHIKTIRLGTRVLTYYPEMILTKEYEKTLDLFKKLIDNGIQVAYMSHFSTPRELLNISTIAAVRRLRNCGLTLKSQSPVMNHISLFKDEDGKTDIDRSAQNWIDLGNVFSMLGIGFHSMYCPRPTGEHHYFSTPLAEMNQVFQKVYRELPSISRPSRYITMTSSAGKTSLLGVTEVNGEKLFVLKFNESRNMEWMDEVYLAKYDEKQTVIERLEPYETDKYFYEDELAERERKREETLSKRIKNQDT